MKEARRMATWFAAGVLVVASGVVHAQSAAGREAFLKNQAMAEVQRVSAQVDVLAANQEDIVERLRKAESAKTEIESLKAEIAALKGEIAEMRRETQSMRGEIVKDLTKKIVSLQPPKEQPQKPTPPVYTGPCYEYVVAPGDTLSLIAKAFNSSVKKIKDFNGMKSDTLRVGQKINVPKE
ncbi:MAG: LysM peptidoglycan-binding domain-containing protein [Kiritimatiellae bacterium]|nr:LysM peptidoglycan-binding domain-containing protein [Kiritimatiellia bacterium]